MNHQSGSSNGGAPAGTDGVVQDVHQGAPGIASVTVDKASENPLEVYGYHHSPVRSFFFWILVVLSGGLLLLITYWCPVLKLVMTRHRCSLREADTVLVEDQLDASDVEPVKKDVLDDGIVGEHVITESTGTSSEDTNMLTAKQLNFIKYFDYRRVRYIWDKNKQQFTKLEEGRAALMTSYGVFKFMALYSIVQFSTVLILYWDEANLGDWMFLYIDLAISTSVAILMGYTGAYHRLVRKRPPGSLVAPSIIFSVGMHMIISIAFQAGTFILLTKQPWFTPIKPDPMMANVQCWETTIMLYVSSFQYLMLAFLFSTGPPYRKPIYTNVLFLICLLVLVGFTLLIMMYPPGFLITFMQLKIVPKEAVGFRFVLLGIVVANFLVGIILESFIVPSKSFRKSFANFVRRKRYPKNKYKLIEHKMAEDYSWPPVGQVTWADGRGEGDRPSES